MKIAVLAPFEETVPPVKYGGTELVVYNLVEELVRQGHDVTLFASGDSHTSAKLYPCVKKAIRNLPHADNVYTRLALNYRGLAKAVEQISNEDFDIVHNHFGWQYLMFENLVDVPSVTTLHGTLADEGERGHSEFLMHMMYRNKSYISISNSQRRHAPDLNYVSTVYNGIDTDLFEFNDQPQDYFAFLGRISPQKGPVEAIEVAKKAGVKLVIAAKIDPNDRQFYEKKVKPLIDGEQIVFLGEVDHDGKHELLKNARGLISPLKWDEPFGLVTTESMSCGTPVLTMARGSMNEIIVNGKTGYLCTSVKEMVRRVGEVDKIKRADCRAHVEKRFGVEQMARGYVAAYRKVIVKTPVVNPVMQPLRKAVQNWGYNPFGSSSRSTSK